MLARLAAALLLFAAAPAAAFDPALEARAERAVADGSIFLRRAMAPEALAVLDRYRAGPGEDGAAARRLAPRLDGGDVAAFQAAMTAEARRPGVRASRTGGVAGYGKARQEMDIWEFPDGTLVRFKPKGDPRRDAPTYSIEVKDSRRLDNAEARQAGVAFKVDPQGRAVPTGPRQVAVPADLPRNRVDDYVDIVMNLGHRVLRR